MLSFEDFFTACDGRWITERTYHSVLEDDVERSHTEFRAKTLTLAEKQPMILGTFADIHLDQAQLLADPSPWPGFSVSFETRSETGEEVAMSLKALFIPDRFVTSLQPLPPLPLAAQSSHDDQDVIQGYYLRDQGYSEAGAIAGRFTYQLTRQTLEMTTTYSRSVAVDQMRFITPDLRIRTIVTYQRPTDGSEPSQITLVGFGVERKQ